MNSNKLVQNLGWFKKSVFGGSLYLSFPARAMGREMKQITTRNPKLHNRLTTLLRENTQDMRTSRIALLLSQFFDNTVETNIKLLSAILAGLQE